MTSERITDPVLGDDGRVLDRGEPGSASFERRFAPTKSVVSILVNLVEGAVPQHQRDLYREVEAWYPTGVQEVFESVRRVVEKDDVLKKQLPPKQIPNLLQLIAVNIRYPFLRPVKCSLRYRFDRNWPDWLVTIREDNHVEWSGLLD